MITLWQGLLILVGLMALDLLQRWIATRKPADTSLPAVRPWYGRDAVAAQKSRPSSLQLALPMVLAIGLVVIGGRQGPFVALGISLGVLREVLVWYLMPLIFRVRDPSEASIPNRMFPLEQYAVQDQITQTFQHWDQMPPLVAAQCGDCHDEYPAVGPLQAPTISASQRDLAAIAKTCRYRVEADDDLDALLAATGVTKAELLTLNRGKLDWTPGAFVVLPRVLCLHLIETKSLPHNG